MNNFLTRGVAAAMLASISLPAFAEEMLPQYFSGGYQFTADDEDRGSNRGNGFFVSAGTGLSKYWGAEISGSSSHFGTRSAAAPWNETTIGLDGLFFYSRESTLAPYFIAGLGYAKTELERATALRSSDVFAAAGLGFFNFFNVGSTELGLRADIRYRWLDTELPGFGAFNEPIVRVGFVLPLGERPKAAPVAAVAAAAAIAPVVAGVAGKPLPGDADGDGVLDDRDSCPGTSTGFQVDIKGCPIKGAVAVAPAVKPSNPSVGAARSFEDVKFGFDRDDLTDVSRATLDNAASVISDLSSKNPGVKVDVSGHTDWIGTDAYNQALSERRANIVKDYLVRKGVDAARISTFAYGETKPVDSNETDEGRGNNRRAEIRTHE